tara:strand:- start:896 stop:1333 length:438 start_codon:yes stop_codon:yes gene_type:complete
MLEAIHFVRKAILAKLNGNVTINSSTVPIYNRVPTDASYPYIRVYSVSNDETDQNQSSFTMETITRVECVTRFVSDSGGELDCNRMVSQCLNLLRTRSANYIDLTSDGFNVYTSVNEGVNYLQDDLTDHTYFRAIIEISNKIEQI